MSEKTCTRCGVTFAPSGTGRKSWCFDCKRDSYLQRVYGVTYGEMVERQGFDLCALCLRPDWVEKAMEYLRNGGALTKVGESDV